MVRPASSRLRTPKSETTHLKSHLSILSCIALLTGWASADLPKKPPISRYTGLWMNSPFTSKPPVEGPVEAANPLSDYALIGVAPIAGGYRVSMINKKNPEERITVDSDNPASKYKILGVTRKAGDPMGTTVRLGTGSVTGTVSYDAKLLTLAAPPAAKPPQPGQPPIPGQIQPPVPGAEGQRQPRPRVVPPPNPAGTVPAPQIQQGQPAQQNNQRPDRRRN